VDGRVAANSTEQRNLYPKSLQKGILKRSFDQQNPGQAQHLEASGTIEGRVESWG